MNSPADFTFNLNITDLTALARQNKLPSNQPVNEQAGTRLIQVLSRIARNNVYILSEDTTTKFELIQDLTKQIVVENVPEQLLGKRVLALQIENLIANNNPQQIESQLSSLFDAIKSTNTILFIDNFHLLVKNTSEIRTLFARYTGRYLIQLIGGTTERDYEQSIVIHANIERRYQPILLTV